MIEETVTDPSSENYGLRRIGVGETVEQKGIQLRFRNPTVAKTSNIRWMYENKKDKCCGVRAYYRIKEKAGKMFLGRIFRRPAYKKDINVSGSGKSKTTNAKVLKTIYSPSFLYSTEPDEEVVLQSHSSRCLGLQRGRQEPHEDCVPLKIYES